LKHAARAAGCTKHSCLVRLFSQLIGEVRAPRFPASRGSFDCEYRREDTRNLFVFLDAHHSWRHVKATERCAREQDFAHCMREISDIHYPQA
jgi:hypothetical protein